MDEILFVTSFSKDLYEISAKNMLRSYVYTRNNFNFLVCYENFGGNAHFINYYRHCNNIVFYDLTNNLFLKNWLKKYSHYIPEYLGGKLNKENEPLYSKIMDSKWNRKTSRWFRKIASLNYALDTYGYKYNYIIWIDCDTVFRKYIEPSIIIDVMNEYGMFYYFGKTRKKVDAGYETGLVGFNKRYNGFRLLKQWIDFYNDLFLSYKRWDDGYILRVINENNQKSNSIKTRDLATANLEDVINTDKLFSKYIRHNKGIHARMKISV